MPVPAPSCACAQALPPLTGRLQPHTWSLPTASAVLKASLQPPKQHTIEIFLGPSPRRGLPSTTPGLPPEIKCKLGWGGSLSPYTKPMLLGLHAAASKSACKKQSTKITLGRAGNLGLIPFATDPCPCKPFPATRQAPPASHPPVHASSPLQNPPRGTGVAPSEQHALVQKERGSVPPAGPAHLWGGTAAGCVALQSTPIRIDLLRFNSLIFFPRSRAAFPQVPGVKLSVLDARKKKRGEKGKTQQRKNP